MAAVVGSSVGTAASKLRPAELLAGLGHATGAVAPPPAAAKGNANGAPRGVPRSPSRGRSWFGAAPGRVQLL